RNGLVDGITALGKTICEALIDIGTHIEEDCARRMNTKDTLYKVDNSTKQTADEISKALPGTLNSFNNTVNKVRANLFYLLPKVIKEPSSVIPIRAKDGTRPTSRSGGGCDGQSPRNSCCSSASAGTAAAKRSTRASTACKGRYETLKSSTETRQQTGR